MCKKGALHHVCGVLSCPTALTSRISFVVSPSLSRFLDTFYNLYIQGNVILLIIICIH